LGVEPQTLQQNARSFTTGPLARTCIIGNFTNK